MVVNKRLLVKSMGLSVLITVLLLVISYVPISILLTENEKAIFPFYALITSAIMFCILTAVFYFDIRKVLENKSF